MGETRREELLRELDARLAATDVALAQRYPGPATGRQPVHTVYIPADRYGAGAVADWGEAGSAALAEHGGDDAELAAVLGIPLQLLGPVRGTGGREAAPREPVEDLRVDFEDGYGRRADAEEDADATAAGAVLGAARAARAAGGSRPGPCARPGGHLNTTVLQRCPASSLAVAPPFAGLRCKSLEADTRARAVRTLDLFLAAYLAAGGDPGALIVTCPKVSTPEQVAALVALCSGLEAVHGVAAGALRFELQVETPPAVLGADGSATVARMLDAAEHRCLALVYGTYDYSAALGVAPPSSAATIPSPSTPSRHAGRDGQHRRAGVRRLVEHPARRRATTPSCTRGACRPDWCGMALRGGLYQGWDMHPAQLPARFLVTYAFFREGAPFAVARLRAYRAKAESGVMDEPATERALVAYLDAVLGAARSTPTRWRP